MGITATATHALAFVLAIEALAIQPLLANLLAFAIAFVVSFSGHAHWTFRPSKGARSPKALAASAGRFVLVALIGLTLNSGVVYTIVDLLKWPYQAALLLMVSAVPMVVFLLSKYWAFTGGDR